MLTPPNNLNTIVNSFVVMKVVCCLAIISEQATDELNVSSTVLK